MKKKQIWGIVAVCFILIFTGIAGVVTASFTDTMTSSFGKNLVTELQTDSYYQSDEPYIGILKIEGTIQDTSSSPSFMLGDTYDHKATLAAIDEMAASDLNEGIFLFLNSGGGTVYESDEVYLKLMEYKELTGRPVWAYLGATACSGAYYIACAADEIVANRNTWTGSIGVIYQMLNMQSLYEKIGIEEITIASGDNKSMGSAGSEFTQEQIDIMQTMIDECYGQFVGIVAASRAMDEADVRELADGRIYSAQQALDNGLIDTILGYEDAKETMLTDCGLEAIYLEQDPPEEDFLSSILSFYGLITSRQSGGNNVQQYAVRELREGLWYYAE